MKKLLSNKHRWLEINSWGRGIFRDMEKDIGSTLGSD